LLFLIVYTKVMNIWKTIHRNAQEVNFKKLQCKDRLRDIRGII